MKFLNIWESNFVKFFNYNDDIDLILKLIEEKEIMDFNVLDKNGYDDNKNLNSDYIDRINNQLEQLNYKPIYTDKNHFCFNDKDNNLYFSKDFYEKNKNRINEAIIKNILNKENRVTVNNYAYSDELIKSLINKKVTIKFDNDKNISDEIKKSLNENYINAYYYSKGKIINISSNKILGLPFYEVISENTDNIFLDYNITDLQNLKYIPQSKDITIVSKTILENEQEDKIYDLIYEIVKTLRDNNQDNKITIRVNNRKNFVKSKLFNSKYDNINIRNIDISDVSLNDLKKEEELLELMVSDIKNSDFSVLEKYMAVYNIVKKFKKYKENEKDNQAARNISYILYNDFIVCSGYTTLLKTLLEKVGINSYKYSVLTDVSYDNGFSLEEKSVDMQGHSRLIIYINDSKYNINGFYVCDPTWDNDLEKDYYNHALMSFDKTSLESRYFGLSDEELIMNVKNMEDFINKINYYLDKKTIEIVNESNMTFDEAQIDAYDKLFSKINYLLIELCPDEFETLFKPYFSKIKSNFDIKTANNFLSLLGNFFIEKLGKNVSIEQIIDVASNVNQNVFDLNNDQKNEYKKQLLSINKEKDKIDFPYYYGEYYESKKSK